MNSLEHKIEKLRLTGLHLKLEENGKATIVKCENNLKKIVIPEGITELNGVAHEKSEIWDTERMECKVEDIILPKSLKKLGTNVFEQLLYLTHVENIENLEYIGMGCFSWDVRLDGDIKFGQDTRIIEPLAFTGTNIKTLDFSECKVDKISNSCFAWCKGLKEVKGLDNIELVEEYAFMCCSSLEKIDLSNILEIKENAFRQCERLREIKLDRIERISEEAFKGIRATIILPAYRKKEIAEMIDERVYGRVKIEWR